MSGRVETAAYISDPIAAAYGKFGDGEMRGEIGFDLGHEGFGGRENSHVVNADDDGGRGGPSRLV